MATIQKRVASDGKTRYRVMVRLKGHPPEYATFKRKTDARQWAEDVESAIRQGRHFSSSEAKRHTVAALIDRYTGEVLSEKPEPKRRDQARHLRWWRDAIGAYALSEATPALIAEMRTRLKNETTVRGRKRSAATVNRYLTSMSHAFTVACREWGWLEVNPVQRVRKLREPRGRVRFLSDEERSRLLRACEEDSRLYGVVLVALSTGARRGEILSLKWPDVDLSRGLATVHETKNRERRALPLSGPVLAHLKGLARVRRIDTDLVFANPDGRATFPRKAWEKALSAAQIDDFRFHDLRHSAASYLAMSGATLAEIAEVLGHKTLAMVKRYAHLTEQHTSKVVARMNEQIFG
jgi:integrase